MPFFIIISMFLLPTFVTTMSKSCNAQFCDPNWTPFNNMVSGLRGYNIRSGNPFQNNGDPGFGGQIFLPTKINDLGRIELEAGITASELSFCQRSLSSISFTTIDSYRKYTAQSSSSGVNLQIGTDTEVTAGIDVKGASVSATKTIPKPFERSWGDSRDFKELTSFFSQKHGLVSVSMGTCTMYEMKLDLYHLPPFTVPFGKALIDLFEHRNKAAHLQKAAFRRFTQEYGTHFLIKSKLGAQYLYRTKYSEKVRKEFNSETLKNCNYVEGSRVFGTQVEPSKSKCSISDLQKLNQYQSSDIQSSIITKGSRPTDIKAWATQDFIPIPLKFKLSPIVNLMVDRYINAAKLKTSDGRAVASFAIRKWFVPLYFNYCSSMNVDCGPQKGCGIDDKCPVDAVCVAGGSKHECGNWGQWTCTVNCGNGKKMRRTRRCTGCKGETTQYTNKRCAPQKECYNARPKCVLKYTPYNEGSSNVFYLDRHRMDCGNHYTMNHFKLESDGGKYRYQYKCCQTQLRCHSSSWRNSGKTYVNGDGDFYYLDRQTVSCPNNGLMSCMWLRRSGSNDVYYSFSCCLSSHSKSCYYKYTPFTNDGNGNTVYLDRQHVGCDYGYGINYLKMQRDGGHDNIRYKVKCCKINRN